MLRYHPNNAHRKYRTNGTMKGTSKCCSMTIRSTATMGTLKIMPATPHSVPNIPSATSTTIGCKSRLLPKIFGSMKLPTCKRKAMVNAPSHLKRTRTNHLVGKKRKNESEDLHQKIRVKYTGNDKSRK